MSRDQQITAAIDAFNALGKTEDVYGKPSPIRARRPILATDCDYEITSFSGVQGVRLPNGEAA